MGALCRTCRGEIERRARRIAHWVAGGSTVILAGYVFLRMPADPTARLVGAMGVAAWYVLTSIVCRRVLRETLK